MISFSFEQWVILALVLVLGWLFGLLSRPGAGKWRRAYEEERGRREAEEARIAAANARIAELERQAPPGVGSGASIAAAAAGRRDDLALIRGVGHAGETRLNDAGVHRYRDVEGLSAADEAALEGRLGATPGTIAQERWREQAALLRTGKIDEHRRLFG